MVNNLKPVVGKFYEISLVVATISFPYIVRTF